MSEVTYKVTLPQSFIAESRTRGGVTIPRDGGYEGPLSAEALKEIKADDVLTIEKIVDEAAEAQRIAGEKAKAEKEAADKAAAEKKAADETAAAEAKAKADANKQN